MGGVEEGNMAEKTVCHEATQFGNAPESIVIEKENTMDKYIVYIETVDGFNGQDFNVTFDSIEQFKGWLISAEFDKYAVQQQLHKIELRNAVTLEAVLNYDVELYY